jgi:hypothetical protein
MKRLEIVRQPFIKYSISRILSQFEKNFSISLAFFLVLRLLFSICKSTTDILQLTGVVFLSFLY